MTTERLTSTLKDEGRKNDAVTSGRAEFAVARARRPRRALEIPPNRSPVRLLQWSRSADG